jgi:hypothetical protein
MTYDRRIARDATIIMGASPGVHEWRGAECVRITLDMWERSRRTAMAYLAQAPTTQVEKMLAGKLGTHSADTRVRLDDVGYDPRGDGKVNKQKRRKS